LRVQRVEIIEEREPVVEPLGVRVEGDPGQHLAPVRSDPPEWTIAVVGRGQLPAERRVHSADVELYPRAGEDLRDREGRPGDIVLNERAKGNAVIARETRGPVDATGHLFVTRGGRMKVRVSGGQAQPPGLQLRDHVLLLGARGALPPAVEIPPRFDEP